LELLRVLRSRLNALRYLQSFRRIGAERTVAEVRGEVATKLVEAINTVEQLAKASASRTRKGGEVFRLRLAGTS
jgi:hypothetical protein